MKKSITLLILFATTFLFSQQALALTYNVTVPAGTEACWIVGDMTGWSFKNRMTKVDATHFTIDIPNAKETDSYKYWAGPDWKYEEADANGVKLPENRTWAQNDVVASWLVPFVLHEGDLKISVLTPPSTIECYITGSYNYWAEPSAASKMTKVQTIPEGVVFEITIHTVDSTAEEFQFASGPGWSYKQKTPAGNFKFSADEPFYAVEEFEVLYDPAKIGTVQIIATVPTGTERVWIVGALGWDMEKGIEGVKNSDGTFTMSVPNSMVVNYRCYNQLDWGNYETDEAGGERTARVASFETNPNRIEVLGWKKVVSGINNLQMDNKVYSSNGILTIEGVNAQVEVFDISGRLIQQAKISGTFNSEKLNRGLYILRVDGKTSKTMVQ